MLLIEKLIIFFVIVVVALGGLHLFHHEKIHQTIFYSHGCTNSSIIWFDGYKSTTWCYSYENRSTSVAADDVRLNNINEIVGYNVFELVLAMLFSSLIIAFAIIFRKNQ